MLTIDGDEVNAKIHDIVVVVVSIWTNFLKQLGKMNIYNYITNPHLSFFSHLD